MRGEKAFGIFKNATMICILLFLTYYTAFLWRASFHQGLVYFLEKAYRLDLFEAWLVNKKLLAGFVFLRVLCLSLLVFCGYRYYRFLRGNAYIFKDGEDKIFGLLPRAIARNRSYLMQLDHPVRMGLFSLLLIQLVCSMYLSIKLPYHYDEAWTYNYFSGKSYISALTFYPLPNNHVLFNALGYFFQMLPISDITAIRLPSVIANVFATYYLFKLLTLLFSQRLSLLLSVVFAFLFAIVSYGAQARGYAMLVFFSVICLYSFVEIVRRSSQRGYLWLYTISAVLGFLTIPSFLYFYVVVNIVLGCFFLFEKGYRGVMTFLVSSAVTVAITALSYGPIIFFNGFKALTTNNGVIKRDLDYIISNLPGHLSSVWTFITGSSTLPLYIVPIALLAMLFSVFYSYSGGKRYLTVLCMLLLVSPVPIILIHKVIPFERTWIFLCLPLIISLGIVLEQAFSILPLKRDVKMPALVVVVFVLLYGVTMSFLYDQRHKVTNEVDYVVEEYTKLLGPKMGKITSISQDGYLSFYLSEDLQFETFLRSGDKRASISSIQQEVQPTADLIVLGQDASANVPLGGYSYLPYENKFFKVYLRNGL